MTMEKLKLCVRWSACRGSPSSISLACFKQEEQTKLMYFSCSNGNITVLPLRTAWIADILSQAPLRDVQRQRCWNRDSGDGQRLWDYGTTERSINAVSVLCIAVKRRGSTVTRTVCKIGGSRYRKVANLYVLSTGQRHKQRLLRQCSGPSKECITQKRTASTEPISKKGIKLIPKTIGNRKGDCA